MTTPRNSQLGLITVQGPPLVPGQMSQFGLISVQAPPFSPSIQSQFAMVVVTANGKAFQELGPAISLGCWSPCGVLAHRYANGE